jgi:hypothetical protein
VTLTVPAILEMTDAWQWPKETSLYMRGCLYALECEPGNDPARIKLGWSRLIDRRIEQHEKRWPRLRVLGVWQCQEYWERYLIVAGVRLASVRLRPHHAQPPASTEEPQRFGPRLSERLQRLDCPAFLSRRCHRLRPLSRQLPQHQRDPLHRLEIGQRQHQPSLATSSGAWPAVVRFCRSSVPRGTGPFQG